MERILDNTQELDVAVFDDVVKAFYGTGADAAKRKQAEQVLETFQADPEAWLRVAPVLQQSNNPQSKFLALNVLEKLVKTRWKLLPNEQRLGIRNFSVSMCLEWSADSADSTVTKSLLNKADLTLVQILKMEWPHNWPQFIPELVMSSRNSIEVCENNMVILRLLSEEVFDYGDSTMTKAKTSALKSQLSSEFGEIFNLCHEVLEMAQRPSLIEATLHCLQKFLSWVPFAFIFESNLLQLLVTKFLQPAESRTATLQCLTEVAQLQPPEVYEPILAESFTASLQVLLSVMPLETDFKSVYEAASSTDQLLISNVSIYLVAFLKFHLPLLEAQSSKDALILAHEYLVRISNVDERELFKGCLDYWSRLVLDLFHDVKAAIAQEQDIQTREFLKASFGASGGGAGAVGSGAGATKAAVYAQTREFRAVIYAPILSSLRRVIIEHMVRPEEVLISENEDGEIVRVIYKESDTITLYKSLRDVLVYLTHLDVSNTRDIMLEKLDRQVDGSEWSWHNMNVLCWAIGSISGAMDFNLEKFFLSTVLTDLLSFTDRKRGKDNKAVVASNIMYIIGQYPRYLRAHWKFLKTVVYKLFEFMHETHEGVQDMACDTFIKIADKCKTHFIELKPDENGPFIDRIISEIQTHTCDLEPHQIQVFYEACGKVLSAQTSKPALERQLEALMSLPNQAWQGMIQMFTEDPSQLTDHPENVKILFNVIRTNTAACSTLGAGFASQIVRIYQDMMALYKLVSTRIVADAQQNTMFVLTHQARLLRSVKRELLRLLDTYLKNADVATATEIAPSLLSTILEDYRTLPPNFREYEVLSCVQVVVGKIGLTAPEMILGILENVFECTLAMLMGDLTEFPEFRVEFFRLLRTINKHCFPVLLQLPPSVFQQTVQACLWAAQHDNRDVEEVGLSLTLEIVRNVAEMTDQSAVNQFFQQFSRLILGDTFSVLTDPDHRSGFALQTDILSLFVSIVDRHKISVPLYQDGEAPAGTTNSAYLHQYLAQSLHNAFPHLQDQQISQFVESLFQSYGDRSRFVSHVRDFLVQIKEFGGDDEWLFVDERKQQIEEQQRQQRERDLKVGGLVKPSDIEE